MQKLVSFYRKDRIITTTLAGRPHLLTVAMQAQQPRASTRAKVAGGAKKSAMAELVAAKAARAERTTALGRCCTGSALIRAAYIP